jgi:hypothetical protein
MGEGVSVEFPSGVSVEPAGEISVFVGGRVSVCGNSVIEFSESEGDIEHAVKRAVKINRVKRKAKYLKILWVAEE